MSGIKVNGVDLDDMSFRERVVVEQEMNGITHLYRFIMANCDEYGVMYKDRILDELKGTYGEFDNFCAEIYDDYNQSFDDLYASDDEIEKTVYQIIEREFDINLVDLMDDVVWLEDALNELGFEI